jgi:hypothetical protein
MANLILDDAGRPMPQYLKQDGSGYEALKGANGAGNIRADDGALVTLGSTADTSMQNTVIGKLQKIIENLMANKYLNLTLLSSSIVTTNGNTADINVGNYKEGIFFLNVTAVSGTSPTLDVSIQSKDPVSGVYFTIANFTQVTDITSQSICITSCMGSIIRVQYKVGGTNPSFTFSVGGVLK